MPEGEVYYPKEANLGQNCEYWALGELAAGCCFFKCELEGRLSCEGIVDDVCLYIKDGRPPSSLTEAQISEIKTRTPDRLDKSYLPPGDIT